MYIQGRHDSTPLPAEIEINAQSIPYIPFSLSSLSFSGSYSPYRSLYICFHLGTAVLLHRRLLRVGYPSFRDLIQRDLALRINDCHRALVIPRQSVWTVCLLPTALAVDINLVNIFCFDQGWSASVM